MIPYFCCCISESGTCFAFSSIAFITYGPSPNQRAIEYYKRFAKLAPKDNGVYTLRYRILEAQEASLEERIEILEELKKKDYQEEWAYELAYLYHRGSG